MAAAMAQNQNDLEEKLLTEADQTEPGAAAGANLAQVTQSTVPDIEQGTVPQEGTAASWLGGDVQRAEIVFTTVRRLLGKEAGTNIDDFRPATSRTRGYVGLGL